MSQLKDNVDLGIIRYANCWEDADVLLRALSLQPGADILIIASAGDNALSLLSTSPNSVHAIDLSLPQLYLTELKQVAFSSLEHTEVLELLGVTPSSSRADLYKKLSPGLSSPARRYWDERLEVIKHGVIHAGKFENYFRMFREYLLPLVHGRKTIEKLLSAKDVDEQVAYYNKYWNTWRWKLLMKIFFSRPIMGKYGRDKQFLKHVNISVSEYIVQRTEAHLRSSMSHDNCFLHMVFSGNFGDALPHYLRPGNFKSIKDNIGRLSLSEQSAEQAVTEKQYDAYCMSNIFEYISDNDFLQLAQQWSQYIPQGAGLAYWNLMVPRSFAEAMPEHYGHDEKSRQLANIDKGFFYSRFLLEHKT